MVFRIYFSSVPPGVINHADEEARDV